jgi:hypothetical protein
MSLLPFFKWCDASALGSTIRDSVWIFPAIEAIHLLGLAAIGGAILMVDLRLLGFGLTRQPVRQVARDAQPLLVGSLAVMLLSGGLLMSSEALRCYANGAFWMKMYFLAPAIVFTFTVRRRVADAEDGRSDARRRRLVALVSLALWSGVGIGGRAIGYY